jgi:methyl-accepting chemotaxis protein
MCIIYYVDSNFKRHLKDDFIKSTTKEIMGADNEINIYLDTVREEVEFLANDKVVTKANRTITTYINSDKKVKMTPSQNGGIEEEIYNLYSEFGKSHPKLKYVYMGTAQGSFIQWPEAKIDIKYDPRVRPWYKAAMEHKGKVTMTSPYYYPSGKVSIISIVKTIQDSKKNVIGVQGVDISLSQLTNMIKNIKIGKTGYIILADKDGTILAHPKNTRMNFKNIKQLGIPELNNIKKVQSESFETELDGKKQLINIYTSPKTHWKFISVIEESELLQQLNEVQKHILFIVGIFVLTAIIIAVVLSTKFSKPIMLIERHLKTISSGDFKKKMPENMLRRKDELGSLSLALEAMQEHLENLIQETKNSEIKIKENFNFLQTLMDTIPNPIFSKDEHGVYNHLTYGHLLSI